MTVELPPDHYAVLDLDGDAVTEEIKSAYRRLVRECHPDVKGDDPEASARFRQLTEAYQVLIDPARRRQYDRTLPRKSYPLRHPTPMKVWREATDVVLTRSDRFSPLIEAMQAAVAIKLEEDLLVVGLIGANQHLSGHLHTAANRNAVLNALEMVVGRRLDYRLIQGTTTGDWEAVQQGEAALAGRGGPPQAGAEAEAAPRPTVSVDKLWDDLVQKIHRGYQSLPSRQLPQVRARYLMQVLPELLQIETQVRALTPDSPETAARGLARAIERLSGIVELGPTQVALELERLRRLLT